MNLTGWKLRDIAAHTWARNPLGTLQPADERTIRRDGQPMALNNQGDTIDLIDAGGHVVQTVTYGAVDEGELVAVTP